jgi:hypothetical protein
LIETDFGPFRRAKQGPLTERRKHHVEGKERGNVSVRLTIDPLNQAERELTALGNDLGDEDIAALAYELWQARGCPGGSPDEDWYQAVEILRSRT